MKYFKAGIVLLIAFGLTSVFGQSDLQKIHDQGKKAYEAGDYVSFLDKMTQANALRPNHPSILYNLAAAFALNERKQESTNALKKVIWMNANLPFQKDEDFVGLAEYPLFQKLVEQAEHLSKEIRKGETIIELQDKLLHPEGIAYSEKKGKFYVGSVHQRKILAVDKEGEVSEFASGGHLNAIMGLKVDEKNQRLWACSTPIAEMMGESENGTAQVVCFDLGTGEVLASYSAPHDNAWLGDLTISQEGDVYASNSNAEQPIVYKVVEGEEKLQVLFESPKLISLQGIALNSDESVLFVADYREGIFRYHFETARLSAIKNNLQHPLKGIDGLYYHDGSLIAIHNGLRPFRIVKYQLNPPEDEIDSFEFIEKALPEMNEPTLGVMVGDDLYYVTNSPWGAYDEEKKLKESEITNPIIRKVKVPSHLLRIFSTDAVETSMAITPDEKTAFVSRHTGKWGSRNNPPSTIYEYQKSGDSWELLGPAFWSDPEDDVSDSDAFISYDGMEFFFVSSRVYEGKTDSNRDIWKSIKKNGKWSPPEPVLEVNSSGYEASPVTDKEGNLYFSSIREEGKGLGDFYFAKRKEDGSYEQPKLLEGEVNGSSGEWNLLVSPNADWMIFESSGRKEGLSTYGDLYFSKNEDGEWTTPIHLKEINSTGSELNPRYLAASKKLVFISSKNLESTNADIYEINSDVWNTYLKAND
ncbi:hypothetical protein [Flagellimonas allohymeniacidonis]|uniref:WD40-like Beta Propeller Repeat n=1 Tax=Flagellimonas allohymeniacidonis TaxID=2517819 RepID=A0A4Q8QEM7_9FLAO|nr:hypothetical protein [Allomuricauda hymeniacidonis]TAI48087.1 hypothetical protein EW142_15685 [Allomuricauda hymeniacidonis]